MSETGTRPQLHFFNLDTQVSRPVTTHPQGILRFWFYGEHLIFLAESQMPECAAARYVPVVFEDQSQRNHELYFQNLSGYTAQEAAGKESTIRLSDTLDHAFTQLMDVAIDGDRCVYCTCRKNPDWTDVAVFKLALSVQEMG